MLRFGGNVIHPGATIRGVLIGHCTHTFLFGAAGGDVVKSGIYARWYRLKMSEVLAAAPLDRLIALVGAILFGTCMMLVGAASGGFAKLGGRDLVWPFVWVGVLSALVILTIWAIYRWKGARIAALDRFRSTLQSGGKELLADRLTLAKSILAAFGVHACLSFTMVACLASVTQATISWLSVLWLFPVISLVSGLPISVGGAGLREGSALLLLGMFQIPPEDAVAASLFTLGISFTWCFVGLGLWHFGERNHSKQPPEALPETITVVIPTLNEQATLEPVVRAVQAAPEVIEVLVADGGSDDGTKALAESLGCRVFSTEKGRGTQMRAAARHAKGDVVWMVHADTWGAAGDGQARRRTFHDSRVVAGGFWKTFDKSSVWMLGSRFRCLVRALLAQRFLGDQAIFVKRSVLEQIGGVPDLPLMEEFELCRRLRSHGRLALADSTVVTSARKFRGLGALRTYWLMAQVTVRYYWGTPVRELAEIYAKK